MLPKLTSLLILLSRIFCCSSLGQRVATSTSTAETASPGHVALLPFLFFSFWGPPYCRLKLSTHSTIMELIRIFSWASLAKVCELAPYHFSDRGCVSHSASRSHFFSGTSSLIFYWMTCCPTIYHPSLSHA